MSHTPLVPLGDRADASSAPENVALQRPWQRGAALSSIAQNIGNRCEDFLSSAGFDRAPWLAVVFAGGILAWFALPRPWQWIAAIGLSALLAIGAIALWRGNDQRGRVSTAAIACGLVFAAGIAIIWLRSEIVGAPAIERPVVERINAYVLDREDQPAQDRIRLILAVRDAEAGEARKIRINVPMTSLDNSEGAGDQILEGAVIRTRVRLMPPASPMLPGSYDFARAAWFKGFAATGSVIGHIEVIEPATSNTGLALIQRSLSSHVRSRVDGSAGTIAAAFASGDRGAIAEADDEAMRDAGLTHLLSISGLHVSAVIAAAYLIALKLLALFPPIALRVRLPVAAACAGALTGIGYTLLTGAEVPTVRSCAAAMLVLIALALGRDALSLRMVAAAAVFVLLLWPESVVGPSFQMSFCAVLAIVALHSSSVVRTFLSPREEPWWRRSGRQIIMLFFTGLVIEIALMPIVLFHFHRAGVYGAFANVIAIPLVTFLSMPLIALGLFLDIVGLGKPAWWLVQISLDSLLAIAHFTSAQPGSVKLMPQMGFGTISLFVGGSLWLALWNGKPRFWGFVPISAGALSLFMTPIPDILVGREGRHVGVTLTHESGERQLLSLRDSRSSYSKDNLLELASVTGQPVSMENWPGAQCSREFCILTIERGGRAWVIMMARNRDLVEERALAAACERSDIVIADRFLPRSCSPKWLKADRGYLQKSGGLAINLTNQRVTSVSQKQGDHGWWRGEER
ncbi:ComEC family competence protein [Erythrobacter insulae]|uniref:ComEC family competence protein n=1 Tax=Erythrobacter insulae TaxID=2584124 RepID=A0A547PEJ2_9SPHN|nr:ComEC/Rec2 family competence protein [Erythrobacter insulae]TRD12563.1 ComEC family competence protein [Erythrobacter insulae]